jgi:hypothetical protein
VIVDEMELIGRLGEVDPLADEVLMGAEATLRAAMAAEPSAEAARTDTRRGVRSRRARRYLSGVGVAAAAALVAVVAVGVADGGHGSPGASPSPGGRPAATVPAAGETIRLASYSFELPAGYQAMGGSCATPPSGLEAWLWVPGRGSSAAAGSASGGCVEIRLALRSTAPIPTRAQSLQVGPYRGFEISGPYMSLVLDVEIPAAQGHHDLVLVARGLSAAQLVAIAKSGLPSSINPTTSCTTGCG